MYKKFIFINFSIIILIIFTIFSINYIVDPYNYNNKFDLNLNKQEISFKKNYRLYKLVKFNNSINKNIILGDSRSTGLTKEYYSEIGYDYYNFAFGGSTLYEIIDTFWYVTKSQKLENVVIGIPFNLVNEYNTFNQINESMNIIKSPINYYFNFFILKVSILNLYSNIFDINLEIGKVKVNKKEFWKKQLGTSTKGFYQNFKYSEKLINELIKIKKYCNDNNINLKFYIPPTHTDLQKKVSEYGLEKYYKKYKIDLNNITKTYDFDFHNNITNNYENYTDPYHFKNNIAEEIVKALMGEKSLFKNFVIK